MTTTYTYYLVTWTAPELRAAARAALAEAAQVDVATYPAPLARPVDVGGLDLAPNALLTTAWGDWSACRPESLPAYLAVAQGVCGAGQHTTDPVTGAQTYVGSGGAWCAWPREATPTLDTARALAWLAAQGWTVTVEVE